MRVSRRKLDTLRLNKAAEAKLIRGIRDVSVSVMYQSKLLASNDRSDSVQSAHVDAALRMITAKDSTDWLKEFCKIVGSALFGAFIPGLIAALSPTNITYVVIFIVSGFLGMFLVFVGLRK